MSALAVKQRLREVAFQYFDLLTHGPMSNTSLFSRFAIAR